jgi:hypothetical protein
MSLLRLLTAGKSLVGVRDTESPYRLTNQRLLPQFGPTRNPFSGSGNSEPAQTEARSPGADGGNGASGEGCGIPNPCGTTATALQRGAQNRTASTNAGGHSFTEALRLRAATLLSGCKAKLAGLVGRMRVKAAKPAIPRFTKPPVQGELSLDKIKVVRNDLSDADLEVVPARTPTAPASSGPALRTGERAGVAESTWGRVTAGFFGAGKT